MATLDTAENDRYQRLRLISWWDQECLKESVVLVIGAGALGNEALEKLALLGVGTIIIVDHDNIENSNLTRTPLFRHYQVGQAKALAAASAVMDINPDVRAYAVVGDVGSDVGWGLFQRAKAVLSCVDNRRARLDICRACWRTGSPWVDGGLDSLDGAVRLFVPGQGPCYWCTLQPRERELLDKRYSCLGFLQAVDTGGHSPTSPTISAVIGGLQAQIAVKLLHGFSSKYLPIGRAVRYFGLVDEFMDIRFKEDPSCHIHARGTVPTEAVVPLTGCTASGTTVGELLRTAKRIMGPETVLDFAELGDPYRDLVAGLDCTECGHRQEVLRPRAQMMQGELRCPSCGSTREPRGLWRIEGGDSYETKTLAEIGIPPLHWIPARGPNGDVLFLELTGDEELLFEGRLKGRGLGLGQEIT